MAFRRREFVESPAAFHSRSVDASGREIWIPELPDSPVLVLGSSQDSAHIDQRRADRSGVEIIRRRSGGGAVLVSSDDLVWFDVIITNNDPLWTDDIGHAFHWLGDAIASALQSLGHVPTVHMGAPVESAWSSRICFAGMGHGELALDGQKVAGISQRRTRDTARFQVAILRRWSGVAHADLLSIDAALRSEAAVQLDECAIGLTDSPDDILDAVAKAMP